MRIRISNGHVIDPANNIDKVCNVFIEDGKISSVGKKPAKFTENLNINAKNLIVCPGIVDLSARLREPGQEHKGTIKSETIAAASAGVTSICCPPDTKPIIDTTAVVELIHQRTTIANKAHVHPIGALTHALNSETLSEMEALKSAGCVGVSNAYQPIINTEVLRRALEYAANFDLTVHLFCEDHFLNNDGVAHEGQMSVRLGLPAIPETAETTAISRALLLIEQSGTRVHFCRLSCLRSIELISTAKNQCLPVTADVSITHLHLTEIDLDKFNSNCNLRPPLRSQRDKDGLREGLANNIIDSICSDHQPHDHDAKALPFSATEPGASTIELLLPLTLELVNKKLLSLSRAIAALTIEPATIAGINAGTLSPGSPADICVFDPDHTWTVDPEKLYSAGKNTPFAGWEMIGKVKHTLLGGKVVYELKS